MAIYTVNAPDGQVMEIEGPDGADERVVLAAARKIYYEQVKKPEEVAPPDTAEGGFFAGAKASFQNVAGDIASLAGRTGVVSPEAAEKFKAEREAEAARIFKPTEEGWLSAPWTKIKETAGQSVGYIAAPLAAGAAATMAGAAAPVAMGAAGLASLAQFTGSNLSRQMEAKGLRLADTDLLAAGAAAVPQAALDIVSFKMLPGINRIFKSAGKELTEDQLKAIAQRNLLTNVAIGGVKTGGVEGLTEVGQQFLERLQAGLDTLDEKARDEYLESFIGGAVLGGTIGGVSKVGAKGRAKEKLDEIEFAREQARLKQQEEADLQQQQQEQQAPLLLGGERPFTPVALPDGSVAMTKEELAQWEEGQRFKEPQGEMFPAELRQAEKAVGEIQGPEGVQPAAPQVQQDLFDAEDKPLAPEFVGVKQAYDQYGAPVDIPKGMGVNQGALQFAPPAPEPTPTNVPMTKMEQELGYTMAERQAEEQKQAELGAIAREAQYQQAAPDLAEAGIIPAQPELPTAQPGGAAEPQQLGLFKRGEAPKPSRGEMLRAGVAPELAGVPVDTSTVDRFGRPLTPEGTAAPIFPPAPITEESVDFLKLPKNAALRKRLIGKDMSDPAQRQEVNMELRAALGNPSVSKQSKEAINAVLQQSEFTRQGEMFAPRGGILEPTPAATPEAQNVETVGQTNQPSVGMGDLGTRPAAGVPSAPRGVEGAGAGGLGSVDRGTGIRDEGTKEAPAPVTPQAAPQAEIPTTAGKPTAQAAPQAEVPTTAGSPFAMMVKQFAEPEAPKTTTKGKKYRPLDERAKKPKETPSKLTNEVSDQLTNVKSAPLYIPLPAHIKAMLRRGDLVGALRAYAESAPGEAGRIAMALAARMQGVKVRVMPTAEFRQAMLERSGPGYEDATGAYYGSTREIYLDENLGFDGHTLLHESTHAVADQVLDNPAHPLTKKLQAIYDALGKEIEGTYGATNLKEFAAEAFGNYKFRELLDTITPQGEKVTLLTKFVRAIRDFIRSAMRLPAVKDESALDNVDRIVSSIVAPGVLGTSPVVSAQQASFLQKGDQKLNAVTRAINAAPFGSEQMKDSVDNFVNSTVMGGAKTLLRAILPLNVLADVAKKYLASAPKLDALVNEKSGYQNKLTQEIEPILYLAAKFAKKASLDQMRTFNDVVYTSTYERVDPSKPRDAYKGDAQKQKVWDELAPKWVSLKANGGQDMYIRIRDSYAKLYDEIGKVIGARIDDTGVDAETKRTVKTQLLAKIMDKAGNVDPYFALTRNGDFWLSYNIFDPKSGTTEPVVEAFETERARSRFIESLRDDNQVQQDSIETFAKIQDVSFRNAPAGSFVNSVLQTLDAGGIDQNTKDQIMQLFINTLPESAIVQSFRKRKGEENKGVLGFKKDALRAFKERSFGMARQLSNIKYSAKISNIDAQLREEAKTDRGQTAKDYYEELHKRAQFAISPDIPKWSQLATSLTFASTLGLNVSSVLVNTSQIPLVVLPYLGGKYGFVDTARAIGNATRVFMNSGTTQQRKTILGDRVQMRVAQSLDNYNFDDPKTPPQIMRYKELAEESGAKGMLNRSQTYDLLDVGSEDTLVTKVNSVTGYLFHYGERMNRQISLMAAYDLELADMKKKGRTIDEAARREAARTAIDLTELTNGGVASAAAPRIAQNALGRVLFMYKRYGVSQYYLQFKMAREALKDADPQVRRAAKRQIAGIFASAALVSGVQGLPMYGLAAFVYDMFKEDDEDDFRSATRKMLGEQWYKGLINDFTGLDVASRVSLTDLLYRDNTVSSNTDPMLALMQTMGGPVFGVAQKMVRGVGDIQDGNVMRGVEQILPSAFGNVLKAYRFGTEGALTRRGDPIMQEFTPQSVLAQALGFSPAEYTKVQETVGKEKEKERARLDAKAKLLNKYYLALREGDSDGVQEVLGKMREFNERNPQLAITGEALRRSMADRAKISSQMIGGVSFNKRLIGDIRESLAEYNGE